MVCIILIVYDDKDVKLSSDSHKHENERWEWLHRFIAPTVEEAWETKSSYRSFQMLESLRRQNIGKWASRRHRERLEHRSPF
jgi:hypothetical protein